MVIEMSVGDILELKKPHPCGSYTWEIIRLGIDCKIKCTACQRIIMLSREELEKRTKKNITKSAKAE